MHTRYLYIVLLVSCAAISAQALPVHGFVEDKETKEAIYHAGLTNKRTKAFTYTDSKGAFSIDATIGDTLLFSHPAYTFQPFVIRSSNDQWVYMDKVKHELEEVEILSDMAKFQKDSADRHIIYRKTIADAGFHPKIYGLGASGLFTSLAFKLSGKEKRNKRFLKTLLADEQARFTNIRYGTKLVMSLTGLDSANALQFVVTHPIPYDYVRTASDLEIKAWVREQYRQSLHPRNDTPIINNNKQR